jgi:hypothetical protein
MSQHQTDPGRLSVSMLLREPEPEPELPSVLTEETDSPIPAVCNDPKDVEAMSVNWPEDYRWIWQPGDMSRFED